ncbi:MAG: DUF3343 domain-containing protein [Deltaproteobacteria bacterium]|jgi:hypothetical protein|nr:DUF3343 domain-containing protein [Deltaproteobacteria bacterium]
MTDVEEYHVILFDSVHHALRSEKILKDIGLPHKLIPVPRHISSDCGICLRFTPDLKNRIEEALAGKVDIREIRPL